MLYPRHLNGLLLCLTIYFIPTGIAVACARTNARSLYYFNLLLGWTLIGWVVALVWSCSTDTRLAAAMGRGRSRVRQA
jgi:hypothetical protein